MKTNISILKYDNSAASYDETSNIVCGNRDSHKNYFENILRYIKSSQNSFLDLGCGTGFYTDIILNFFPEINCVLLDGSDKMLSIAREKFKGKSNISFIESLIEDIKWKEIPEFDIVFSSLAVHHLEDSAKWRLFGSIHKKLNKNGVFIYFDLFRPQDLISDKIIEYFSCYDIKKRIESRTNKEIDVNKIIENDRRIKKEEGDREATLPATLLKLEEIGFHHITQLFQDNRYAGIIAYKDKQYLS
jgi:tRNA (cmo5U34)-methyltransferase